MKFSFSMSYDAAPDRVYAMLGEPEFREQVCAAGYAVRHNVSLTHSGTGMTVVMDQYLPTRGIPPVAAKFVGEELHIVQTEEWSGPEGASLDIAIPGKPGWVKGAITLAAAGSRTVETITGEVKINVPLVGGKLEKMIEQVIEAAMRNEERVGHSWLDGDR
ncbi:DUF2505 domain-containing protein [Nocardioides mesophilus]|uniref:DUF2505 domain-containing protein n=1 Tax=Nocardioides mesophilus TaxID=433659 RepID=A0A7G9RDC1_9ACTN|nr:DUF2505 domain-containing protein [Nocardioides mesophilus]QNN53596.1 DUF2505 domain-containing protein [Nocardioides mesophilus]